MLKKIIQTALGCLGLRLIRVDNEHFHQTDSLILFFLALKGLGFAPKHIIDVGANRGDWTRQAVRFFPHAHYTLIEPQDHLKPCIQDLLKRGHSIKWVNLGVGDQAGTMAFTLSSRDDSSSFVTTQEEAHRHGHTQIPIMMKTLNEIVTLSRAGVLDMVKIDAEGFDLKVLSGASDLLGKTEIFLVEAIIFGRKDENTLPAVMDKMASAGYAIFDITALNRSPKTGLLWLCEIAFIKNDSFLLDGAKTYE